MLLYLQPNIEGEPYFSNYDFQQYENLFSFCVLEFGGLLTSLSPIVEAILTASIITIRGIFNPFETIPPDSSTYRENAQLRSYPFVPNFLNTRSSFLQLVSFLDSTHVSEPYRIMGTAITF